MPTPTVAGIPATVLPARVATAAPTRVETPATPTRVSEVTAAVRVATATAPPSGTPLASPLQIAGRPVADVAASPDGRALFGLAGGDLYRLDAPQLTPVGRPPAGRLLALDPDRLAVGDMGSCARGGGAPLRWSRSGGVGWRDADVGGGRSVEGTPRLARGGDVYALACAGVLLSADGGRTFRPVLRVPDHDPVDFDLAPDGATAYLAAVSEGGTLRVVRTEKRGADWSAPTTIDTGQGRAALAAGDAVALATAQGVKLSRDRGATWSAASGPAYATSLVFRGAVLYAATPRGVVARTGDAWTPLTTTRATRLVSTARALYAITPEGAAAVTSS